MNAIILTTQSIIGDSILEISYIIASLFFVFGLKMLSHPDKARKGNIIAAIGMGLAIVATILLHHNPEGQPIGNIPYIPVSYTHLRAHETGRNLVCRLLLEKKKKKKLRKK